MNEWINGDGRLIISHLQAGFFRREYKEKQEAFQRESWDFVQKSSEVY